MGRRHQPEALVRSLVDVAWKLRKALAEALGPAGVTPEQMALLHVLAEGPRTPRQLAEATGRDETTLSRSLKRAVKAELVSTEKVPGDARRRLLRLTERGVEALAEAGQAERQAAPELVEALSDKERRKLAKLARKLQRALEAR